jgi:hypothetical protein
MGTLYDGIAVFAAADGAVALAADQNTIQAKLILGLQARWKGIDVCAAQEDTAGGSNWEYNCDGAAVGFWEDGTGGSLDKLKLPLFFRDGEYLTDIKCVINGNMGAGGSSDGTIKLYEMETDVTPAISATITNFGAASPWDVAGVITEYTVAGITAALDGTMSYLVEFLTHDRALTANSIVYSLRYRTRFHEGV